jgi:hypothetical protein
MAQLLRRQAQGRQHRAEAMLLRHIVRRCRYNVEHCWGWRDNNRCAHWRCCRDNIEQCAPAPPRQQSTLSWGCRDNIPAGASIAATGDSINNAVAHR